MTVDTEELRRVADFQDFAAHADLIRAAAQALDDFELESARMTAPTPSESPRGNETRNE